MPFLAAIPSGKFAGALPCERVGCSLLSSQIPSKQTFSKAERQRYCTHHRVSGRGLEKRILSCILIFNDNKNYESMNLINLRIPSIELLFHYRNAKARITNESEGNVCRGSVRLLSPPV